MASKKSGKDISDPAGGRSETRGGKDPSEWIGPLPETPAPPTPLSGTERAALDDPAVMSAVREAKTGDHSQLRRREATPDE